MVCLSNGASVFYIGVVRERLNRKDLRQQVF